ncbi:hypothetical protein V7S43_010593 [Phytophthora oleae]|uniref:Uncharacterized protein n=1 Tax=Phytophthora oleae TaxID=2107226 RepID=A0ABD3FCW3_9STRA
MDQFVPRLSRHPQVGHQETTKDTPSISEQQPLQLLGPEPFPHETSAALDAALAFSDSDGGIEDTLEIDSAAESGKSGAGSTLVAFDAAMSSEIDKKLEFSDEEEDVSDRKTEAVGNDVSLLGAAVLSDIDKELKTSSDGESPETGRKRTRTVSVVVEEPESGQTAGNLEKSGFDAISNEIEKELETSSDEEDDRNAKTNGDEVVDGARENVGQGKRTLMSIDDELDDEFAALESDSEPENHGKEPANGPQDGDSSSSDSDSSDSSNSDSDEDDPMIGPVEKPHEFVEKEPAEATLQNTTDGGQEAPSDPTPVVVTTPVEKRFVAVYSPAVEVQSPSQTPEPLQLASKDKEESNVAVAQEQSPVSPQTVEEDAPAAETNCVNSPIASELQQPELPTLSKADQPVEVEAISTSEPSDAAIPDELARSPSAKAEPSPDIQAAKEDISFKKTRKAEEASLDDSQAPSKKAKVDEGSKKKPVVTLDERRMKKSLSTFQQAIVLGKEEKADNDYARRTISLLVHQSSKFIDTHLDHVTRLCQVLAGVLRKMNISPISIVRGALGIFQNPRSRRPLQDKRLGLSWLCNEVLTRLSPTGSQVDECLLHLRGFLVEERPRLGDSLTESKPQKPVTTKLINVTHDIVFLVHICALHTHLCQSTGQLSRSRVLLFDILRGNPNIRGLYFTMVMAEVYPTLLEREFDQHCVERQQILKETVQQALVDISSLAASREQLLLLESSLIMLHRIADAIQMPELESMAATDPKTYVEKLFDRLRTEDADSLELVKSLELCVAVYSFDVVTQVFSVEKCQELFATGNLRGKSGILSAVGHIAATTGIASDTQKLYVESVLAWLYRILSSESTDLKLRVKCSSVCIELILVSFAPEGLESRRRALCAIVKWFDATPMDELLELPATFLRRLRLAVVASRPTAVETRQ